MSVISMHDVTVNLDRLSDVMSSDGLQLHPILVEYGNIMGDWNLELQMVGYTDRDDGIATRVLRDRSIMHCISGIAMDHIRSLSLQIVIVKADLLG